MQHTRRRHPQRRQTRRPHRQTGGAIEEDYEIIRSVYRYIDDPGVMIAAIYNTRELYEKCTSHAPKSLLGGKRARDIAVPDRYARPEPRMKPLNSVLRCAFNFFDRYADKARGDDAEPGEWAMAKRINIELEAVFWMFVHATPEMKPSRSKSEKADKLFNRIRHYIEAATRSGAAAGANTREDREKAAEEREKAKARMARAAGHEYAAAAAEAAAEAEAAAAAAYAAAAAVEGFGSNLGTARRHWENAQRREGRAAGGAGDYYAPGPTGWGKSSNNGPYM